MIDIDLDNTNNEVGPVHIRPMIKTNYIPILLIATMHFRC